MGGKQVYRSRVETTAREEDWQRLAKPSPSFWARELIRGIRCPDGKPIRRMQGQKTLKIAFHIDELTQANVSKGMKPAEARRQAILEFGGREQVKQELREVHSSRLLTALGFNLKSAWRFARRSPSFSIAIILILAFAIGANSAVFSAMDAVVLRPLPFPDADQLILLGQHDVKNRDANRFVAPVRLEDWPNGFHVPIYQRILHGRPLGNVRPTPGESDGGTGRPALSSGHGRFSDSGAQLHSGRRDLGWSGGGFDQLRILAAPLPWRPRRIKPKASRRRIRLLDRRCNASRICFPDPRSSFLVAERPGRSLCSAP